MCTYECTCVYFVLHCTTTPFTSCLPCTGHGGVVFTFGKSSLSTNGTDTNSGQFSGLYYSVGGEKDIPSADKEEKPGGTEEEYLVPVTKSFSLKVNLVSSLKLCICGMLRGRIKAQSVRISALY